MVGALESTEVKKLAVVERYINIIGEQTKEVWVWETGTEKVKS